MTDTTSLSSFPVSIDTFDRISDLDIDHGTLEKSQIYKQYIEDGNYETAEQYLNNNQDLAQCAINAKMINKHSDAIIALENETLKNYTKFNGQSTPSVTGGNSSSYTAYCSWYKEQKYTVGQKYTIKFHTTCSDNALLSINDLGPVPILYNGVGIKADMIKANDIITLQYYNYNNYYGFYIVGQVQNWGLSIPQTADERNTETITPTLNTQMISANGIKLTGSGGTTLSREDSRTLNISSFEYVPSGKGKELGKFYIDNIESVYYTLYYQAFRIRSLDNSPEGTIYLPDTDWYLTNGLANGTYEKVLVGIEGSLIAGRNMYPLGYNDGNILVNAYMGREAVSPYSYRMIISYKGIQKNNITEVRGILKYTIATA